jgi:outer membrane protein assembly factor BamD
MRFAVAVLAAVITGSAVSGCEGPPTHTGLNYTEDAKRAYDRAMVEFNGHNWIEAQAQLREVKRKYGYSKYARLAELRYADADFEQEKYGEAIREYKDFVRAHRSDADDAAYARSRIAEAVYREVPESFILSSAEERDQAAAVDAYKELRSYLADYPNATQAPHVHELLETIVGRLIDHELYVARFYLNRDNYDAAVARVLYALRAYIPTPTDSAHRDHDVAPEFGAKALLLLGETYLKMKKWSDARAAFESIVRSYDTSPTAVQAKGYLEHMHDQGV